MDVETMVFFISLIVAIAFYVVNRKSIRLELVAIAIFACFGASYAAAMLFLSGTNPTIIGSPRLYETSLILGIDIPLLVIALKMVKQGS